MRLKLFYQNKKLLALVFYQINHREYSRTIFSTIPDQIYKSVQLNK